MAASGDDPLDLTGDDHLVVNTAKDAPGDQTLPVPPQSPEFVPPSIIDEDGQPTGETQ
jgi:hypothetical protein